MIIFLAGLIPSYRGTASRSLVSRVDNLSVHEAAAVDQWLADKKDRIELFPLPKYAPERNPDEYLNCDLKA
ncbi:MAG: transposase, partial [Isosphaeraceae bacterium]